MKRPNKTVIVLISIPLLMLLLFSSNIYGYFRFKSYCSSEGGLRVYEKLEKNVGWLAKDKYEARDAALIKYVAFIRYTEDGKNYDLKYIGGNPTVDDSYQIVLANDSVGVKYKWRNQTVFLSDDNRLKRFGYEVVNLADEKILAGYYIFYYSAYGGALGGPDWQSCTNKLAIFDGWVELFNTIFKN